MKNLKILYLTLGIIGVSLVIIFLSTNVFSNKNNNIVSNDTNFNKSSNNLAMMLETPYASGEYQETTDTTWEAVMNKGYVFNEELSKCENGGTLTWNSDNQKLVFTGSAISDKCYVYFDLKPPFADLCNANGINTFSDCITTYAYTNDGVGGLYYHDGLGSYGEYEAGDYSYRYSGADPDNYVCFGTNENPCPTDNLYRIIGVFNDGRAKLIKYDYATSDALGTDEGTAGAYAGTGTPSSSYYKGSLSTVYWYYWNTKTTYNTWNVSSLNGVNLNTNFWAWLGSTWQNYIDDTTWIVGGNTSSNIYSGTNSKTIYDYEITNPATSATYTSKIGLMYVSEYRYAADPSQSSSWSNLTSSSYNSVHTYNWMSMGDYDWTITRCSDSTNRAFFVYDAGYVSSARVRSSDYTFGVRPTFNLKSSVVLESGSGTISDPYRIA